MPVGCVRFGATAGDMAEATMSSMLAGYWRPPTPLMTGAMMALPLVVGVAVMGVGTLPLVVGTFGDCCTISTSGFHCAWAVCEILRLDGREPRRESEGRSRMSGTRGLDGGVEKVSFSGPGETMLCMIGGYCQGEFGGKL